MLDATGYDIGPLLAVAAEETGLSVVLILAMLRAESGLDPFAAREGVWPDVSYGYSQLTVQTAAAYGIGDGSNTVANRAAVKATLFDREASIRVGARHLLGCWLMAEGYHDREMMALRVYNGGGWGLSDDYAVKYPQHIASYRAALEWAAAQLVEA